MNILETVVSYFPSNIGELALQFGVALLILIIWWIIAKIVSSILGKAVSKLGFVQDIFSRFGATFSIEKVGSWVKTGSFIILLLFVLTAFFQALNLSSLAEPLSNIIYSLPQYLWVLALACFTWVAAVVGKHFTTEGLSKTELDAKAGVGTGATIGTAVYGFIILFFLPGILGGLWLQEIVAPVEWMLNQMIGYVPNILGAGIILAVWVFVARLVKQIFSSVLQASKVDAMASKVGMNDISISNIGGTLAYVFIIIPVVVSALDKLWIDAVSNPAKEILGQILAILPNLIWAIVLIWITYVVANFASKLIGDLLKNMGFDDILSKIWVKVNLKTSLSALASKLIMAIFMLFAAVEAGNMLGLTIVSDMVEQFLAFGGSIIGWVITIFIGMLVANMVGSAMKAASTSLSVSNLVRMVIIILSVAIGLWQMGVAEDIINMAFGLGFGAIAVAFALAVGLGSRDVAARELDGFINSMKK